MCGIALIVNGIRIIELPSNNLFTTQQQITASSSSSSNNNNNNVEPFYCSIDDLKVALQRRGPDSLGTKKVVLEVKDAELVSHLAGDEDLDMHCSKLGAIRVTGGENGFATAPRSLAEMFFVGAVLQLRGTDPVVQPLVDSSGNVLVYNGEIFGGVHMSSDSNDAEVLMQSLQSCCCCYSHDKETICNENPVPVLLSTIKGPWAAIYWQNASRTLWFGRDAFGRRSLLVHWPTSEDSQFLLSSVSPPSCTTQSPDSEASELNFWEELSCGVYSMSVDASIANGCLSGKIRKHEWTNPVLKDLIRWDRVLIEPKHDILNPSLALSGKNDSESPSANGFSQPSICSPVLKVLEALRKSIARRTIQNTIFEASKNVSDGGDSVPVAVLFSGGLDSMILAAILHECLDARYGIDLLTISFEGDTAPDRITAKAGVQELRKIAPLRKWRLVEIDAALSKLTLEMSHVMSLINPAKTYMDMNIGLALWLAAGGDGWVYGANEISQDVACQRFRYKSQARILLVGSGADEQCAGYGRHRVKYKVSSWLGLHEEMKLDMQRIWKRNLGRDDRCIADNGKEARFPFLDEDVIRVLLDFPLWEIANLNQKSGMGDKKILREVARALGLQEAASQPKRAIQFGSRIAQASNRKFFGSNRAANQAYAGSADINKCMT